MQLNHLIFSHFVKLKSVELHQHWLAYWLSIRARFIALPLSVYGSLNHICREFYTTQNNSGTFTKCVFVFFVQCAMWLARTFHAMQKPGAYV